MMDGMQGSRMAYVVSGLFPDPNEHHQIFIRVSAVQL